MSEVAEKKPETTEEAETMEEPEDDEEDLEKLQAEIARMEAEAARITKETEELEKKKDLKMAAAGLSSDSKAAGGADKTDGYVPKILYSSYRRPMMVIHSFLSHYMGAFC
jgi:hypothetical protein